MLIPQPIPKTYLEIEEMAQQTAAEYEFDREVETIREFVRRLGGRLEILDVPNIRQLDGGSLRVHGPNNFEIFLSPTTGVLRDNFTIAHELGHYFLHSGTPLGSLHIEAGRYGDNPCERQANRFAAALLMPADEFRRIAERTDNNATILAGRFGVSVPAAQTRIASLRLNG